MSCDVGKATEGLLHLRHSSFSNPSFASPTSQALHLIHLARRPWRTLGLLCTVVLTKTLIHRSYHTLFRSIKNTHDQLRIPDTCWRIPECPRSTLGSTRLCCRIGLPTLPLPGTVATNMRTLAFISPVGLYSL